MDSEQPPNDPQPSEALGPDEREKMLRAIEGSHTALADYLKYAMLMSVELGQYCVQLGKDIIELQGKIKPMEQQIRDLDYTLSEFLALEQPKSPPQIDMFKEF